MYAVKKICIWMIMAITILIAMKWTGSAWCLWGLFIPASVQGLILTVVAALPMAIFGILPQAVVADISQSDSITSGSNREGMFYAARTFAFKLGQSISMLIFTAVSTIGAAEGTGYRVAAFGAAVFCCIGGIILVFYNEKKINGIINRHQ